MGAFENIGKPQRAEGFMSARMAHQNSKHVASNSQLPSLSPQSRLPDAKHARSSSVAVMAQTQAAEINKMVQQSKDPYGITPVAKPRNLLQL